MIAPRPVPFRALALSASLASFVGALYACGGETSTSSSGDAGVTSSDASIGARPAACPKTLPAQGTPCSKDKLLCEYGDDYKPWCNTIVVCSGDRWASPIFGGGGGGASGGCGEPPPSPPPNPPSCPTTMPEGACTDRSVVCNYPGKECHCGVQCSQYPVAQPCPDAGDKWYCLNSSAYCATPRQTVGSACTQEGSECALAPPGECGQASLRCSDGVWTFRAVQCPISTAKAKEEIHYLDESELAAIEKETLKTRLATYRYKGGDPNQHLGFIIEDQAAGSPAVLASRERVDLYGYVSMAVGTLQMQSKEIAALRGELAELKKSCRKSARVNALAHE